MAERDVLHKLPLSHAIFRPVADHQARDLHLKASITSISFHPQYFPFMEDPSLLQGQNVLHR